jgi:hypothetical protein
VLCSTIIPTVARPTLDRAVGSVLAQELTADEWEVIVVNDSGQRLPEAGWLHSERVRVIDTGCRERSVARNAGAALARGRYLHFLDDDDWLLPGGLACLRDLARTSNAGWLYGGTQLVDRQGKPLIRLEHDLHGNCSAHVMAGEWIPLQSSIVRSEAFFAVGGFNPSLSGSEDNDLLRRLALHSDLAGTPTLVACIGMGEEGSTTDKGALTRQRRWAREIALDQPAALARLLDSARTSSAHRSYWYGRITRVYLTSVLWNLRHKRPFTAASRATFGLALLALAGRHLVSAGFWHALAKRYEAFTFARGFQERESVLVPRARDST